MDDALKDILSFYILFQVEPYADFSSKQLLLDSNGIDT